MVTDWIFINKKLTNLSGFTTATLDTVKVARIRAKVSQCWQSKLPVFFVIAIKQWRASIMWENHDDNWGVRGGKSKDNDVDININVNVDRDGERCFDNIYRAGGSAVQAGLNLCDVARGLRDVQLELRGPEDDGIFGGIRDGIRDGVRDGIRDGIRDGMRDGGRDGMCDVIRIGDAVGRGGLDFNPPKKRDGEPPYIDCEWGRLLEQNKTDMLHKSAKMGAALKDAEA